MHLLYRHINSELRMQNHFQGLERHSCIHYDLCSDTLHVSSHYKVFKVNVCSEHKTCPCCGSRASYVINASL